MSKLYKVPDDPNDIKTALPRCKRTGKPILEISHSGLNSFASCPRKWAFRKAIQDFQSEPRNSIAGSVGTALHEGFQSYMIHKDVDKAVEALAKHHPIEIEGTKPSEYSIEASVFTLLEGIKDGKLEDYELAYFNVGEERVPAVEVGFLVEIECKYVIFHLRGFIDLVLMAAISELFMAVDIKTTTPQGSAHFETKYKYDWQCTSYGIPLQGLLGVGDKFQTAIYGVIQSDYEPRFLMPTFSRTSADVEQYYIYLLDKCAQIERYWVAQHFPRQPTGCMSWGRPCYYFDKCDVHTVAEMQFAINPSMKAGVPPRPFKPVFTAQLENYYDE